MRFSTSFAAVTGVIAAAFVLVSTAFAGNGIGVGIPAVPAAPGVPAHVSTPSVKMPAPVVLPSARKHVKAKHWVRRLATAVTTIVPVAPGPYPNTCTLEEVLVTGTQNVVMNTSLDANGNGHVYLQIAWQKTTGQGIPSGMRYSANDTVHTFDREYLAGTASTLIIDDEYELISNGPSPNMILHSKMRIDVDADGVPTMRPPQFTGGCRG
jgi:hypothetical protein